MRHVFVSVVVLAGGIAAALAGGHNLRTVPPAARPFDRDVVLARRVVEALELAGPAAAAAASLLKELADRPGFRFPAAGALSRLTAKT